MEKGTLKERAFDEGTLEEVTLEGRTLEERTLEKPLVNLVRPWETLGEF